MFHPYCIRIACGAVLHLEIVMIAIQSEKKQQHIFGIPNKMCAARVIYHEQFLIENMNRAF